MDVEQALGAVAQARQQLFAIHLAIANDGVVVRVLGQEVVQIELDQRFHAALHARFNQPADAQARHDAHRGADRNLGLVVARVFLAMVVQIQAVEDQLQARRRRYAADPLVFPLAKAARVEAEIEIGLGPDGAVEAGVQAREHHVRFLVFEQQVQVGQIVIEQVDRAAVEDEVEQRGRVFQHRNAEALLGRQGALGAVRTGGIGGGRPVVGVGCIVNALGARQRLFLGFGELGIVARGAGHVGLGSGNTRLFKRFAAQVEGAEIDSAALRQHPLQRVDEFDGGLDQLQHLLGLVHRGARQLQARQVDQHELGDAQVDLGRQQRHQRLERLDDVVDGVKRIGQEAAEHAADVERDVLEDHLWRADLELRAARCRQGRFAQHLVVVDDGGHLGQRGAAQGRHLRGDVGVDDCVGLEREDWRVAKFQAAVAIGVGNVQAKVAADAAAALVDVGELHRQKAQRAAGLGARREAGLDVEG